MHSFWLLPCGWSIEQGSSFLNPGRRLYPAGVLCISHTCKSLQQCGRISLEPGRPRALEVRPTVVGVRAACAGRLSVTRVCVGGPSNEVRLSVTRGCLFLWFGTGSHGCPSWRCLCVPLAGTQSLTCGRLTLRLVTGLVSDVTTVSSRASLCECPVLNSGTGSHGCLSWGCLCVSL